MSIRVRHIALLISLMVWLPIVADNYIDDVYYWQTKVDRKLALQQAQQKQKEEAQKRANTVTIVRKETASQAASQQPAKKQSQVVILTPEAQRTDTVVKAVIKRNYNFGY